MNLLERSFNTINVIPMSISTPANIIIKPKFLIMLELENPIYVNPEDNSVLES